MVFKEDMNPSGEYYRVLEASFRIINREGNDQIKSIWVLDNDNHNMVLNNQSSNKMICMLIKPFS